MSLPLSQPSGSPARRHRVNSLEVHFGGRIPILTSHLDCVERPVGWSRDPHKRSGGALPVRLTSTSGRESMRTRRARTVKFPGN